MNRRMTGVIAAAIGVAVVALTAQQKPNFSGHWVAVSPSDAAGEEQFIKHEGTTLTTSHRSEGDGHRATYTLDGKESRNVITSHGADIVTLSHATWNGGTLTITSQTTFPPDQRKISSKQTWSLDGEGRLVIEFNESDDGGASRSVKMIFVKK